MRKSLRKSINAKCKQCLYDPGSPGRCLEQIACCVSVDCALFDVRPMPASVNSPASLAALRHKIDLRNGPRVSRRVVA